jgi:DHA2 family multidrug resistance protein
MLSNSTLESGISDFFWPLIIRGIGMSILFVPLTTLAIQELHGPEIGQGTGLNNMMRQLGGSFGIAILTTLIHLKSGIVRSDLVSYLTDYNPAAITRKAQMIHGFVGKGYTLFDATRMANQALEGTVVRQTLLVTYDNLYLTIGVFVLFCIPIVYLQKFKRNVALPVDAH